MFGWIPNAPPIDGVVNVGWRWIGSVHMEEVVTLDQTIRNLIFGDAKISFVVIQLGVTRLKKTRSCISSPRFAWGKGEKGRCDLVCGRL